MHHKKNRITILLLSLLMLAVFLQVPSNASLAEEKQLQADDEKTIRFVLIPEKNIFEQRRRYKYITDYLSAKMDMNFIVKSWLIMGILARLLLKVKPMQAFSEVSVMY